ncbi:hypothetical protein MASR2M29_00520 [Spirochaetota bacterium]
MKKTQTSAFIAILFFSIISCVSGPAPAEQKSAPEWILRTPAPDATYSYFVASSSDANGDTALATEDAAVSLISQITRYMGVDISVATTGEAKGTIDSYSAEVKSVVKQTGASKLSGFTIKDRYVVKEGKMVTVYVLAQYITSDLNKEKARIAAVFKEKEDAVAKPELAGDSAASQGRAFDAIKFYIEAAVAASGSGIDNADIKMERNVNKARALLGKLRFVRIDAPSSANLAQNYPKPFMAKLVFGESDTAPGIPGAEAYVSFQRRQTSGRVISRTERVMTDSSGVISFSPPPPDFVGKATLKFSLNLDSARDLLDKMPDKFAAYVDAISEDMSRRSLDFDYTIVSMAKTVPTGVVIIDLDKDGKAAGSSTAQGGLFEAIAKEKFKVGLAPIDASLVISMNDSQILKVAKAQYGSNLQRLIYGIAKPVSAEKDGSMWQAQASVSVRCIDFATGMILYSGEKTAIAVAADEASARKAALLQAARDAIAKDLMANLP